MPFLVEQECCSRGILVRSMFQHIHFHWVGDACGKRTEALNEIDDNGEPNGWMIFAMVKMSYMKLNGIEKWYESRMCARQLYSTFIVVRVYLVGYGVMVAVVAVTSIVISIAIFALSRLPSISTFFFWSKSLLSILQFSFHYHLHRPLSPIYAPTFHHEYSANIHISHLARHEIQRSVYDPKNDKRLTHGWIFLFRFLVYIILHFSYHSHGIRWCWCVLLLKYRATFCIIFPQLYSDKRKNAFSPCSRLVRSYTQYTHTRNQFVRSFVMWYHLFIDMDLITNGCLSPKKVAPYTFCFRQHIENRDDHIELTKLNHIGNMISCVQKWTKV